MAVDTVTAAHFELKAYGIKISGMDPQHAIDIAARITGQNLSHQLKSPQR
jgi:hypothetical protein